MILFALLRPRVNYNQLIVFLINFVKLEHLRLAFILYSEIEFFDASMEIGRRVISDLTSLYLPIFYLSLIMIEYLKLKSSTNLQEVEFQFGNLEFSIFSRISAENLESCSF